MSLYDVQNLKWVVSAIDIDTGVHHMPPCGWTFVMGDFFVDPTTDELPPGMELLDYLLGGGPDLDVRSFIPL
jgi:hypothetical protein